MIKTIYYIPNIYSVFERPRIGYGSVLTMRTGINMRELAIEQGVIKEDEIGHTIKITVSDYPPETQHTTLLAIQPKLLGYNQNIATYTTPNGKYEFGFCTPTMRRYLELSPDDKIPDRLYIKMEKSACIQLSS